MLAALGDNQRPNRRRLGPTRFKSHPARIADTGRQRRKQRHGGEGRIAADRIGNGFNERADLGRKDVDRHLLVDFDGTGGPLPTSFATSFGLQIALDQLL